MTTKRTASDIDSFGTSATSCAPISPAARAYLSSQASDTVKPAALNACNALARRVSAGESPWTCQPQRRRCACAGARSGGSAATGKGSAPCAAPNLSCADAMGSSTAASTSRAAEIDKPAVPSRARMSPSLATCSSPYCAWVAGDLDAKHRPAWTAFNQRARRSAGGVGVWHETYEIAKAETVYVDLPPTGLAAATTPVPVGRRQDRARDRLAG